MNQEEINRKALEGYPPNIEVFELLGPMEVDYEEEKRDAFIKGIQFASQAAEQEKIEFAIIALNTIYKVIDQDNYFDVMEVGIKTLKDMLSELTPKTIEGE